MTQGNPQPGKIATIVAVVRQLGVRQTVVMLAKAWSHQIKARFSGTKA